MSVTEEVVILEWKYTPEDFFEEPPAIREDGCVFAMEAGRIKATMEPTAYDPGGKKGRKLHTAVESHFRAVQLVTHKMFELRQPGLSRVYADGRREITLSVGACISTGAVGRADLVITDQDGNVITDTRRERLDLEQELAESIARIRPTDPLLEKLLDSYTAAVEDPNNELVHLFEVRDALQNFFGDSQRARSALNISKPQWNRLGGLACDEPIQEGRHRGAHLAPLREATTAELEEARRLASTLIKAYLQYALNTGP